MPDKIHMVEVGEECFQSSLGHTMKREYGKTPSGNDFGGKWVLRDSNGNMMGFDRYRNDLVDRFDMIIVNTRHSG